MEHFLGWMNAVFWTLHSYIFLYNSVFPWKKEITYTYDGLRVSKLWDIFIFGWTIPLSVNSYTIDNIFVCEILLMWPHLIASLPILLLHKLIINEL